jgi:hypothetical protein
MSTLKQNQQEVKALDTWRGQDRTHSGTSPHQLQVANLLTEAAEPPPTTGTPAGAKEPRRDLKNKKTEPT